MSAVTSVEHAKGLLQNLAKREQIRHGGSLADARGRIASAMGVMPGTLYNLARDRLKRLDFDFRIRLSAYAMRDLEHEIAARRHELEVARALGSAADPEMVARLEKVIAEAVAFLAEAGT